jgi:hypothetical protein
LPNGKVLIAGGWASFIGVFATTELYDPVSNSFAPAASVASMSGPCDNATATLDDGSVTHGGSELYTP